VRHKIPKASDEAIISVFANGVTDVRMSEKLAINDDLSTALELFNLADKCARAKEGRLTLLNNPDVETDDKKTKAKEVKRKGPTMLAAEPEQKRGRDREEPGKDGRLFCVYHNVRTHNTHDCQELRALRDERMGRRPDRTDHGFGRGGGRGGG
jgi:hypothetical protein